MLLDRELGMREVPLVLLLSGLLDKGPLSTAKNMRRLLICAD